jgi:hypothetical protein
VFFGKATRLHRSFNDPAAVEGTEKKRLGAFSQSARQASRLPKRVPAKGLKSDERDSW